MKIMSYVELTPAQIKTIEALGEVIVRKAPLRPTVVATIRTFQQQNVKLTIDADGVIENVEVQYDCL